MTLFLCFIKFGKLLAGEYYSPLRWGDVILNEVKNLDKKIPRFTRNDTVFLPD